MQDTGKAVRSSGQRFFLRGKLNRKHIFLCVEKYKIQNRSRGTFFKCNFFFNKWSGEICPSKITIKQRNLEKWNAKMLSVGIARKLIKTLKKQHNTVVSNVFVRGHSQRTSFCVENWQDASSGIKNKMQMHLKKFF